MRQIDLVSSTNGIHWLEVGMDTDEIASFSWQLWLTKYGKRAVDWLQNLSLGFCSFMGGSIWIHNSDTVNRCNLFGEQKDCIIGVIANENPNIIKIFDSIGIHSEFADSLNGEWEITEITIPVSSNYPNGMYSKIPTGKFKKEEGVMYAEFLRNMKSTSNATTGAQSVLDALNGEELRGHDAYMLLKSTTTDQLKLFKIDVKMTQTR